MKWEEVRELFPNQFVKIKVLESYIEDDKEKVCDVAVIKTVDESKATKELLSSKGDELVYHTSKEEVVIRLRNRIGLRRA
ncbi:MAG TPA: hypothetical protein GX527_08795 [Clostridiaceae bacterium]|jgi:hypothetical protein|nr:hypothetical protein [Clostridiaceae bacterium]